jgi:hypothetical protein
MRIAFQGGTAGWPLLKALAQLPPLQLISRTRLELANQPRHLNDDFRVHKAVFTAVFSPWECGILTR